MLPRSEEKSERAVIAAEWGTAVHKWKETGEYPSGRWSSTLQKKVKEAEVEREQYWTEGLHEVPLSYNVITGEARALVLPVSNEKKQGWKDAFGDEWITGTADYLGLLLEQPWVDDLKTGRKVDDLDYRYQQGFYCLVWTLFSMGELTPARSTITHWPKYPIKEKPRRFGTVLEPEFFLELQGKLKTLREEVMKLRELEQAGRRESVVARLSDGPQCKYCPSRLACTKGLKYDV